MMPRRSLAPLLLFLAACAAPAAVLGADDLRIEQAWARPTPPAAKVGGAFFRLDNRGSADRLVAASSPVANAVELHTHRLEDGVAKMRAVPAIDVPARSVVELKPGGLHLMLIGLKAPLKAGETFAVTLRFAQAGERTVDVRVGDPAARAASAAEHDRHHAH